MKTINKEKGKYKYINIDKEAKLMILSALFVTFLVAAVLTGSKIIVFFGLTFSAGTLAASLTYLITDVVCEVWGKEQAKKLVLASLIGWIALLGLLYVSIIAPSAPFWKLQSSYEQIFSTSIRLIIGGFIAYAAAQFHDIWAFNFWKNKTKGKHLWLRNNLSTATSQLINTILIVIIGFSGSIPHTALLATIFGWWLIKLIIAVCDTPFVYILVRWASRD